MKILHCADLHLDSKMESNLTKEQAGERKQELITAFNKMIDYAKENDISVIMIAGDLFDTLKAQQKRIKQRVFDVMRGNHSIDFICLNGNHDEDIEFNDYLREGENLDNVKVIGDEWTTYRYGKVAITGCALKSYNNEIMYEKLALDEKDINIVMMHGLLINGTRITHEDDLLFKKLQNKNIDYLALGHVHEYGTDKLDNRGYWVYPGCLEGRGFDECGDKGFVVVDVNEEDGTITHSFVVNSIRKCHEITVELDGALTEPEIKERIAEETSSIAARDLVKVVLKGEISEDTVYESEYLKKEFENTFYFFKLYDETKLAIDYASFANDVSLKGEFIRCVHEAGFDEEMANKIIVAGIRALAGREI